MELLKEVKNFQDPFVNPAPGLLAFPAFLWVLQGCGTWRGDSGDSRQLSLQRFGIFSSWDHRGVVGVELGVKKLWKMGLNFPKIQWNGKYHKIFPCRWKFVLQGTRGMMGMNIRGEEKGAIRGKCCFPWLLAGNRSLSGAPELSAACFNTKCVTNPALLLSRRWESSGELQLQALETGEEKTCGGYKS